jgi:hypothetical protein
VIDIGEFKSISQYAEVIVMNSVRFHSLTNTGLVDAGREDFFNGSCHEPKILFLGGLLHLSGQELGAGLWSVLNKILPRFKQGIKIYTPSFFDTPDGIGQLAQHMYHYAEFQQPTDKAQHLVDYLFFPETLERNLLGKSKSECDEILKNHFSQFKIIAYSYGVSLLQQVERILAIKLNNMGYDTACLSSLRAINIGPVATPYLERPELTHHFVRAIQSSDVEPRPAGRFRQFFIFRDSDKVVSEILGEKLIQTTQSGAAPYAVFGNHNHTYICESSADNMIRRAGIGRYASGMQTSKITFQIDFEGHGLHLYTNRLELGEYHNGSQFADYPTSNLAVVIPHVLASFFEGQDTDIVSRLANNSEAISAKDWLRQRHADFDSLVRSYNLASFQGAIQIVEAEFDRLRQISGLSNPLRVDWHLK